MAGELGKASLDLEANLGSFERNVGEAEKSSGGLRDALEAVVAAGSAAERALNDVKMQPGQAASSRVSAEQILQGVRGIGEESRAAALEIDRVKLSETQANESEASALRMDRALDGISRNADQTRRKLAEVRLAGGRNGVGVGPFGSGFGRIGLLGGAIGLGALTGPAAAPAALGLLASIPTLAAGGTGALGTLALAFDGVSKAIGGDKKAFDDLSPAAQQFVQTVRSLDGFFDRLRATASASLFPGLTAGLKAALSPGTVSAITKAIAELGSALGKAAAEWGRYFGSPEFQHIFGPLMQSAARNIGVLADAALHLFDALGVIARAAIPFTNWITDAIDKGAKLADAWVHAASASGELSRGMSAAETSLRLVGGLALSLLRVIGALGQALYPVAKVAVKDLTNGLNALARLINQNRKGIADFVRGALDAFVTAVKVAVPLVVKLARAINQVVHFIGGWKIVLLGLLGLKFGLVISGWVQALKKLIGVEGAGGLLGAEGASAGLLANLTRLARLGVITVEVLLAMHFVTKYGFKNALRAGLTDSTLGNDITPDAMITINGKSYPIGSSAAYEALVKAGAKLPPIGKVTARQEILAAQKLGGKADIPTPPAHHHRHRHTGSTSSFDPKPGTHAWYMKYLGYDPTQQDPFGAPPPFKSTGDGSGSKKPPVIPQRVSYLEALAGRQDQQAAALNYAGKAAQRHLDKEITDLQKADQILHEKLKNATGKRRTELYKALTENLKKIDEARKRIKEALDKSRQSSLNFALDQAKVAVENAKEGSKAWDRAIKAEETALQAEIRYWDKRAHNDKLSKDARDAALRKELSYEKQLKSLTTATAQAASANEAQFLSSFIDIQNSFAPNAVPYQAASPKTDTHLHDIKQEARQTNRHLKEMRDRGRFPGSRRGLDAAMAVGG